MPLPSASVSLGRTAENERDDSLWQDVLEDLLALSKGRGKR